MSGNGRMVYSPYGVGVPMDGIYGIPMKWQNQKFAQQQMGQVISSQENLNLNEDGYPYKRQNPNPYQTESINHSKMHYVEVQLINKILEKLGPVSSVSKDEIDALIVENSKIINRLNRAQLMGHKYRIKDIAKLQRNLAFLSQLSRPNL